MSAHNGFPTQTPIRHWSSRAVVIAIAAGALWLALAMLGVDLFSFGTSPASSASGALPPLGSAVVPKPTNLGAYVADEGAAIKLGKALFWDMDAGSDGKTACASCHFAAGADRRTRNTLNPGKDATGAGQPFAAPFGPNTDLTVADFPLHKLSDPSNAKSAVVSDTTAVVGSQGVVPATFNSILAGQATEDITLVNDPASPFYVGEATVRRSTGRNTPSVINAVFNFRNFWDGRAQNHFNGVNPFGTRDASATIASASAAGLTFAPVPAGDLNNASLASQAVGPPGNGVEMSADGRTLRDIGKKLLALQPLGDQAVAPTDSVLGTSVDTTDGKGLSPSYRQLVQDAFNPWLWQSTTKKITTGPSTVISDVTAIEPDDSSLPTGTYTQMQYNWPLFWGLAINLYESTLVSDQTPLDRFVAGDSKALSSSEKAGFSIFTSGKGFCSGCHGGAATTNASVANISAVGVTTVDNQGSGSRFDTGFINIGVRPTGADVGNGGTDPFGNSLSETVLAGPCALPQCKVDGSFKIPALRNVGLTAPYFHNGGQATLEQVVDFYNRGGDFANAQKHRKIRPLGFSATQKAQLVDFLRYALTDPRVLGQAAPFDHPQIFVPNGHARNPDGSVWVFDGRPVDNTVEIPATGAAGGAPLPSFLGLSTGRRSTARKASARK